MVLISDQFTFRYQVLLVVHGTSVLRKILENEVGLIFANFVAGDVVKEGILKDLIKRKIINADQSELLPPKNMTASSADFDLSLIICLLRNFCALCPLSDSAWFNPRPTDQRLEADITRLRLMRNHVSA